MLRNDSNNQWLPPRNADGVWNLSQESNNTIRILQESGTSLFRVETPMEELSWFHANDNDSVSSQWATGPNAIPIDVPWNAPVTTAAVTTRAQARNDAAPAATSPPLKTRHHYCSFYKSKDHNVTTSKLKAAFDEDLDNQIRDSVKTFHGLGHIKEGPPNDRNFYITEWID